MGVQSSFVDAPQANLLGRFFVPATALKALRARNLDGLVETGYG